MARNPISDLEAAAAMPGLEQLTEVMAEADTATRRTQSDPVALLLLLIGRWAFGSLRMAESSMTVGGVWDRMRVSALRVGRRLPADPPTVDQLNAWRGRVARRGPGALETMARQLSMRFTDVAVPLVQEAGLLTPSDPRWHDLQRGNVLYADGSGFDALSSLDMEDDGSVSGSRSRYPDGHGPGNSGPRVAPAYVYKDMMQGKVPAVTVGVHGGRSLQRGVVAVRQFRDGREVGAAMSGMRHVLHAAAGGVHGVVYDQAMSGFDVHDLMRAGVLPVVQMKPAQSHWNSKLRLPEECQRRWYAKGGKTERRQRRGKTKESDRFKTKTLVRCYEIDHVSHTVMGQQCDHIVHAIDGCLVVTDLDEDLTIEARIARRVELVRGRAANGTHRFVGRYELPCRKAPLYYDFDHTGLWPGRSGNGRRNVVAARVHPLPEADPLFERILGWREDAESTFSTLKRRQHLDGRAGSLDPDNFLIDLVAAGMFVNAVLWDEHAAGHTDAVATR